MAQDPVATAASNNPALSTLVSAVTAADLGDTLNARFASAGPWRGPRGQAGVRLRQELEERWTPYLKREINKVDAAQALIDTPEEYARVAASCNGAIKTLTR